MIVEGRNVILEISTGSAFAPIMCNASCKMNISTSELETTFEDDAAYRGFIPDKHTITIDGSGPIVMGSSFTAAQATEMQLARTIFNWKFQWTDGTNTALYSGTGFFISMNIDGTVNQAATCDYTIKVSGQVAIDDTPPPGGDGSPAIWTYIATGGETTIGDPVLLNGLILDVERSGIGVEVITAGSPGGSQVKSVPVAGTLQFGTPLGAGEFINVLFLE